MSRVRFPLFLASALALTWLPAVAHAQTLGLRGGLGISTSDDSFSGGEPQSLTGFSFGGYATFGSGAVGIQIGATYIQKGAGDAYDNDTLRLALDYVEIPVLLRISLPVPGVGVHFYVGPAAALEVGCLATTSGGGVDCSGNEDAFGVSANTKSIDFALILGAGLDISVAPRTALTIEAFYERGHMNIFDVDSDLAMKNRTVALTAGLAIDLP